MLRATEPWRHGRRVVLVAFTPIGTLSLQTDFNPHAARQLQIPDFFNVRNQSD